jgi:biopolymer transport protein ExbB
MINQIEGLIRAGGFVMYPLLIISIIAVAVIIERLIVFTNIGDEARGLLEKVLSCCEKDHFEDALDLAKKERGPVAAGLATILQHRTQEVETIERNVQEIGEEYFLRLEQRLSILDTATTVSPLLGLLGTIVGMIGAFDAISAQQANGNNDAVLHGVAEALYATASGISIAVVCFIAYNYFSARLRSLTAQSEIAATKLINVLGK